MEKEKVQAGIIGNGYKKPGAKPGAKPARVDTRRQKTERIMKKERWD